jgi:hypothetical protein
MDPIPSRTNPSLALGINRAGTTASSTKQQNLENERLEAEKKKPVMNDFAKATRVSSYIIPRPSQYALHRLENFEYLDLWCLTQEGCAIAAQYQHTQDNDAFSLTKVDDAVALIHLGFQRTSFPMPACPSSKGPQQKAALIQQITKY